MHGAVVAQSRCTPDHEALARRTKARGHEGHEEDTWVVVVPSDRVGWKAAVIRGGSTVTLHFRARLRSRMCCQAAFRSGNDIAFVFFAPSRLRVARQRIVIWDVA
jgi:hypothetical protein